MANLTLPQQQEVVALLDNLGYQLVMDAVKAYMDDLLTELEESGDSYQEASKINEWRAARRIYSRLLNIPQSMSINLEEEKARLGDIENIVPTTEQDFHTIAKHFHLAPSQVQQTFMNGTFDNEN